MNILPHWWQNGVIYQIYPKSFQDTTGSGTGDLRGVTARLDYLKKLGVDAIWLTPFYVSPQVDNGYDVANYTAIDPSYGTLEDFDQLVAERKRAVSASCWIWCLTIPRRNTNGSASR
jgi:Glycosidases